MIKTVLVFFLLFSTRLFAYTWTFEQCLKECARDGLACLKTDVPAALVEPYRALSQGKAPELCGRKTSFSQDEFKNTGSLCSLETQAITFSFDGKVSGALKDGVLTFNEWNWPHWTSYVDGEVDLAGHVLQSKFLTLAGEEHILQTSNNIYVGCVLGKISN
jgi:hypothetical protein